MKNFNPIIILLIVIGLIIGGVLFFNVSRQPALVQDQVAQDADLDETTPLRGGSENGLTQNGLSQNDAYSPTAGVYQDYDPALLANANMGDVVLFFKAGWCPTCAALDRDLNSKLDQIPEDVTILKVDYDTSQALREKYDVRVQHTLVQVDAEGNELNKWQGSLKLEQLLSEVV